MNTARKREIRKAQEEEKGGYAKDKAWKEVTREDKHGKDATRETKPARENFQTTDPAAR